MNSDKYYPNLEGRHAIVTGASSGLGRHFASTLANHGAGVTLAARRVERLEALRDDIIDAGGQADLIELDVTDTDAIGERLGRHTDQFGVPDILINNAGTAVTKRAINHEEGDWDHVMDTNLKGLFFVAKHFASAASQAVKDGKRPEASIVNIASIVGLRPASHVLAYAVAKAGVVQLTKCLALEWVRHGIRVNAIAPGYIKTELNEAFFEGEAGQKLIDRIPQRQLGEASDLDGLLLLLVDGDRGRFMTGGIYPADGGHLIQSL
ncbi:MAG: SDR family oxidoreductase [Alphaproteobacteria bacterium]|nr:SDR family oxidoreductase [Alphaproteobacteria bacterium SS10]